MAVGSAVRVQRHAARVLLAGAACVLAGGVRVAEAADAVSLRKVLAAAAHGTGIASRVADGHGATANRSRISSTRLSQSGCGRSTRTGTISAPHRSQRDGSLWLGSSAQPTTPQPRHATQSW